MSVFAASTSHPRIAYLMAAHDAAPWIETAIRSALAQIEVDVAVVVVDDASRDATAAIVEDLAKSDTRVTLLRRKESGGPAAARNMALDHTSSEWIGILDADDRIDPERSARLIALAEDGGCEIAADNLCCFDDEDPGQTRPLLASRDLPENGRIDVARYLERNLLTGGASNLGFLKPIMRRERARRYDERLRIGEDFDFCLRCMASGSDIVIDPRPMYQYRVRAGSLTRQLKPADIETMIAALDGAFSRPLTPTEARAGARLRRSMTDMLAYVSCRQDLRRHGWRALGGHARQRSLWRALLPLVRRRLGA